MFSADKIKEAITNAEEGMQLFKELNHKFGISYGLNLLGEFARLEGDYARAGRLYKECLAMSKETGNKMREVISLANLSYVAHHQGKFKQAIDYCRKALTIEVSLQMEYASAITLAMIAGPISAMGFPKQAARMLSASKGQLNAMGATVQPGDKHEVDRFTTDVRQQLSEVDFNAAWAEGQSMTMQQVIAEVMSEPSD
jgi:tetratricopeptide (TPR) repeat protein